MKKRNGRCDAGMVVCWTIMTAIRWAPPRLAAICLRLVHSFTCAPFVGSSISAGCGFHLNNCALARIVGQADRLNAHRAAGLDLFCCTWRLFACVLYLYTCTILCHCTGISSRRTRIFAFVAVRKRQHHLSTASMAASSLGGQRAWYRGTAPSLQRPCCI